MRTRTQARCACALILSLASVASAHGYVGDRFFPPTITTDDPFAVDELALPTISYFTNPAGDDSPRQRETDVGFELDKEIFSHFALGISDTYIATFGHGGASTYGFDNLTLTAKYELWHSDAHEAIVSIGLETDVGGTGDKSVAESFSTFAPNVYFGKGFGDLPDSMSGLKPFAVTGVIAQNFPTKAEESNSLEWGFALEYSLPYLQQHVKDVGIPAPFKDMIPLVEFSMETGENRDDRGHTTGTINPGLLWETKYFQLGGEALIPINGDTGPHVGFVVQMWIYIDDIFPKAFGHPLFGSD